MNDMSDEEFRAELNARKPGFEKLIREKGMLVARDIIIGSVPDTLRYSPARQELIDWWDENFNQQN
jgi:hypothetical protein